MLKDGTLTYVSLFSSAGVGCYGFKQAGFTCIATNELLEKRLQIQKFNNKCNFETGYICDDIKDESTKTKIFTEIGKWRNMGNDMVDVLIATPPCQGMSVANHKKTHNEIDRNSLVVESIQLVSQIQPRFFIFENVSAFMKTGCTAPDGSIKTIGNVVFEELSGKYTITSRILNLKNYGSNSSRTRTIVIGVLKKLSEFISPIELYPVYRDETLLLSTIGEMQRLDWGEISKKDFYHSFRTYPDHMRSWINELEEGKSAFDNIDIDKRPHKIINNEIIINQQKNGDKYTRQSWNKVAPCIHTRNDQLASQNTIHPTDDRVFSIRELMRIMTIPDNFKWLKYSLDELNSIKDKEKQKILKKEEMNIRQSIGEAVPTKVLNEIAFNISSFMKQTHYNNSEIIKTISTYDLVNKKNLMSFIDENPLNCGIATLARIAELVNSKRENNAAYYTNKFIINEIFKELPEIEKDEISIIEPSVGVGNFLPFIFHKYERIKKVNLDLVDIDKENIDILKLLLKKIYTPNNFKINFITEDFLQFKSEKKYDLIIGNPPFTKLSARDAKKYLENNYNKKTKNTFEFFLEKAILISDYVAMITPKALLNTPEFHDTRELLKGNRIDCIIDFGELGFKGVLVETICLVIKPNEKPKNTKVISLPSKIYIEQNQSYITDPTFPYWLIYRNKFFDGISEKLEFNLFSVFRDRQITNSNTTHLNDGDKIRVLKSRNISDDGTEIISIDGYDSYIDKSFSEDLSVFKYLNRDNIYLTPNMTYKPRVSRNIKNILVNGSVAILIPKSEINLTNHQLAYFSTKEYRKFYKIARNFQTRSLNVDASSVYFYGVLKEN